MALFTLVQPATRRLLVVICLLCAVSTSAQAPIKNPSGLIFTCPDHDRDDQHEIDIVRESDGAVIQTLLVGDPPPNPAGDVVVSVNVQPVAFGRYRFVVRAIAGAVQSENSLPSALWERAPSRPAITEVR